MAMAPHEQNEQYGRPTYLELENYIRLVHRGLENGSVMTPQDKKPVISLHAITQTLVSRLDVTAATTIAGAGNLEAATASPAGLDGPTLSWVADRCDDVAKFQKIPLSFQTAASELGAFFRARIGGTGSAAAHG